MSNLKIKLILIAFFCSSAFTFNLYGEALFEIQTGNSKSASWHFTNQLSEYWKRNLVLSDKPRKFRSQFVPRYVKGFFNRFKNLNNRKCKLIVAPLSSISELPIAEMPIKIVAVLWETYLTPIESMGGDNVGMYDDRVWVVPEDALIIPSFFNTLQAVLPDSSADMKPELVDFVQSLNWPPSAKNSNIPDTTEEKEEKGFSIFGLGDDSDHSETESDPQANKINVVDRSSVAGLINEGFEGILFFEMIGPHNSLLNKLGSQYQISSLDLSFTNHLLRYNWFLDTFSISKLNVKTVGVTYALFVHEEEDPEFVKELIGVLARQPKTNFERSYLMKNLALNMTKEISPIFLHESTISFFNID